MSDNRQIADDKLYAHFVTFSTYKRRRILDHDHPKRIVLGVLNYVLKKHQARCIGFVIMPDHVHALVWFPTTGQLSAFMHEWKRQSSLRIRNWYREKGAELRRGIRRRRSLLAAKVLSVRNLLAEKIEEKLTYMHQNPVRTGLVAGHRLAVEFRPLVRVRRVCRRTHPMD